MKALKKALFAALFFVFAASFLYAYELNSVYKAAGEYKTISTQSLLIYYPTKIEKVMPRIVKNLSSVRSRVLKNFPDKKNYVPSIVITNNDDAASGVTNTNLDLIDISLFDEIGAFSTRGYSLEKRFAMNLANIMVINTVSSQCGSWLRSISKVFVPQWYISGMVFYYAFPLSSVYRMRLLDMARNGRLYSINSLSAIERQSEKTGEEMAFQAQSMIAYWVERYKPKNNLDLLKRAGHKIGDFAYQFKKQYGVSIEEAYKSYVSYITAESQKNIKGFESGEQKDFDGDDLKGFESAEQKGFASSGKKGFKSREPKDIENAEQKGFESGDSKGIRSRKSKGFKSAEQKRSKCGKAKGLRQAKNDFMRSYRAISETEKIWVSSNGSASEMYSLFYQKAGKKPVVLLKNVHHSLLYNEASKEIYIGAYRLNSSLQKCLNLYSVLLNGKKRRLTAGRGSFKPLRLHEGRLYYANVCNGLARVMSVDAALAGSEKVEYQFSDNMLPLDLALNSDCTKLFYTVELDNLCHALRCISLNSGDLSEFELFRGRGSILALQWHNGLLWFSSEKDFNACQLFSLNPDNMQLLQYTQLPGGVWDITFKKRGAAVITLNNGHFEAKDICLSEPVNLVVSEPKLKIDAEKAMPQICGRPYEQRFSNTYLSPVWGKDEDGLVLGYYNSFIDRLGRIGVAVSPAYGLKTSRFSYYAMLFYRLGQFRLAFSSADAVFKKTYRNNDYYEREKNKHFELQYPLNLSTAVSVGADAARRSIAENNNPKALMPTMGRDNSVFAALNHLAIRDEPYINILPRKGRSVLVQYRRGDKFLDGQMNYNRLLAKVKRYTPLDKDLILGLECYVAEDDKMGGIRRPDDLELGSSAYLRAFDDDDISGDSLRYFSLDLSFPFYIRLPQLIGWVYNEFSALKLFFEAGDVRGKRGNFNMKYDRGVELNAQLLLLKRLPVSFCAGYAAKNGMSGDNFYVQLGYAGTFTQLGR